MDLSKAKLAIVDDNQDIILALELFLKPYFSTVTSYSKPTELEAQLEKIDIDVLLLDMNYHKGQNDGSEGLQALERLKKKYPKLEVIAMTAYAEVDLAVKAIKQGAFDFVTKPWQNEKVLVSIMNAVQSGYMKNRLQQKESILSNAIQVEPLIGESEHLQFVRKQIHELGPTHASLLIIGEKGVGKSLVATHLHLLSGSEPTVFITIDFSAINLEKQWTTLYNESFESPGKWQLAKGGTLYLKEISQMTVFVQERLHKLINTEGSANIRLISSTSSSLPNESFNRNLLYELNAIELVLEPLRKRVGDLLDLLDYFLEKYSRKYNKSRKIASSIALDQLKLYPWYGNARELEHAVEKAVILDKPLQSLEDLIPAVKANNREEEGRTLEEIEKRHISKTLKLHAGNIQKSALDLGISRAALYRRIEKYSIK